MNNEQVEPSHIVVPCALIIKEGKLLMDRRNDPANPQYHGTWETPGGSVEFGETVEQNVIREVKEEIGYDIEIISMLGHITTTQGVKRNGKRCQIYLIPFVCRVVGGRLAPKEDEVLEVRWFDLDSIFKENLIEKNDEMLTTILPELKQIVKEYNL